MKLVELHREFIDRYTKPMVSMDAPIRVANPDKPLIVIEKWKMVDGKLNKKYLFETFEDRNRFLKTLFEYETQVGHHAVFKIDELQVIINLCTKDVDHITELDKEYAKYADTVRKDLVYNPTNV